MRATQSISSNNSYRLTPAQRRLSAALTGPGMRKDTRRSAMPPARKAELIVAVTGSLILLSIIGGMLAL